MKALLTAAMLVATISIASAQNGAGGTSSGSNGNIRTEGATGEPNSNPAAINSPSTTSTSGSGTSTSGGKDDNGDQGRDKMPESNMDVKQRSDKPNLPNPSTQ